MARKRLSKRTSRTHSGILVWFLKTKAGRRLLLATNIIALIAGGFWYSQQPPSRRQEIQILVSNYLEREKDVRFVELAWDLWQYYYGNQFIASEYTANSSLVFGGIPDASGLEFPVRVLINKGYGCGYSDALKNPVWVGFRLFDPETPPQSSPRPDEFLADDRTFVRVQPSDYTNSGYDRGHLAPNFGIARCYGPEAQLETFFMSNIIPQTHALNAGPWRDLEMRAAINYPARFQEVWVFAGPVFGTSPKRMKSGVPIPEACYKIMLDETEGKVRAQAFLFPQSSETQTALEAFLVSIDDIEFMTGLDFFPELEESAEMALESRIADRIW